MRRVSRKDLLGFRVLDRDGNEMGRVIDTWPDDGGWEVELVVVRLLRFGERRMVSVKDVVAWAGFLCVPYTRAQVEDSPAMEGGRYRADEPYRAMAYWRFEEHGEPGIVTPPWRRSSGFSATEKRSPTSPSPTPTVS
jgi:hypothetical protein